MNNNEILVALNSLKTKVTNYLKVFINPPLPVITELPDSKDIYHFDFYDKETSTYMSIIDVSEWALKTKANIRMEAELQSALDKYKSLVKAKFEEEIETK